MQATSWWSWWRDWWQWSRPKPKPAPAPVPVPAPLPAPTPALPSPTPTLRPPLPPEVRGDGSNTCADKPAWAGAAVVLGSCIQLKDYPAGEVELAWLKIESLDAAGNVIATGTTLGSDVWGQLSTRFPFWNIGVGPDIVEPWRLRETRGASLLIHPDLRTDKIWHFWARKQALILGTKRIRVSARVKIMGGTLLSIGSDWWRSASATRSVWGACNSTDPNTQNTDGPQSKWYTGIETKGEWLTITVP